MRNDKVWNPKLPEMPVDKDGNWMNFPGWEHKGWEIVHQPFPATMTIDGMQTGRSSKIVILKNELDGKKYPMFVVDLVRGIQDESLHIAGGKLTAHWTGSKRGANYGIKAINV